ncbi:ADP-ribosylglycohydrolase family protein (plasmid) [Actinacidiphila glaucinigra]|uniref:ADP-ribosylglycohydrolase family protein n=1 Tax=Actinacidiphila glaucinigra TaxID=235986 RepID=UPI002DD9EA56|nr:ADP-ribosylglycohydrolase family protein [Actinacidiphila glaucinigra]WSD65868.1 ADP-ribosylglycohydrolase family protein [Actinacidiphila glaucinigra]
MASESYEDRRFQAFRRSQIRGCLLGGALGDALGNPAGLFQSLRKGAVEPVADVSGIVAQVTDATQMTLFTAEGLIRARVRALIKEVTAGQETFFIHDAYLRWLETQENSGPPPASGRSDMEASQHSRVRSGWLRQQSWLYARRSPGKASLNGLRHEFVALPDAEIDGTRGPVNPGSKGCGAVMRSAPIGLTGFDPRRTFTVAANSAKITHGHPTGYYAASALATIIAYILQGYPIDRATHCAMSHLTKHRGHEETSTALRGAIDLAAVGRPTSDKVRSLGAGWVADEALAIAVYCALAGGSVREALQLAANHSDNRGTTGAICGNLLGACHGDVGLPTDWLALVEGRGVISELSDDFDTRFHSGEDAYRTWDWPAWGRYDG